MELSLTLGLFPEIVRTFISLGINIGPDIAGPSSTSEVKISKGLWSPQAQMLFLECLDFAEIW